MKNLNYNELNNIEGGASCLRYPTFNAAVDFTIGVLEGLANGLFGWGYCD